ncbi:MAG TPA: type II toxin-antitoxin system VapB family antitoxin [Candidatus Brocadiaceae bacterium]|nr:type II toxin-antitoxin system VapB family antitoxin [Candidatus Brocadiaceae bacterium]
MKTLVDINDSTLKKAMELSGTHTKKETIMLALEELIRLRLRQRLKDMAGSGFLDMGLTELKESRQRREKIHKILKAGNK